MLLTSVMLSLGFLLPQNAFAQAPAPSLLWQRPTVARVANSGTPVLTMEARAPDYRWEGMAIGAGVGALAFGLLGAVVCGQSESGTNCTTTVVGLGALGAFCGGIIGGVIGGGFSKEEKPDSTEDTIEWGS